MSGVGRLSTTVRRGERRNAERAPMSAVSPNRWILRIKPKSATGAIVRYSQLDGLVGVEVEGPAADQARY